MGCVGISTVTISKTPFKSYLDSSIIRRPCDEGNLASRTLARRQVVGKVVYGVSRALGQRTALGLGLGVDKLLAEAIPVGVFRGILDHDLLVVVGELVDDVLDALAELELVELADAFLRNLDTAETSCQR